MGLDDDQRNRVAQDRSMPRVPAWVQFVDEVTGQKTVKNITPVEEGTPECEEEVG